MLNGEQRGSESDQQVMATFHYKQELRRTIRLFGSFAVAFSFISITTGIFLNYSLVLDGAGPAGFWTWPIVTIGQLLVALVFAELAGRMPLTGYSYQWVTRLAGPGWGWFTGWVAVCFLIIVVPSVDHALASVIGYVAGVDESSLWLKVIVCMTMVTQALIHVLGVRLANLINSVAVFTEVVGMVGLVVLFAGLMIYKQPSGEILWERGAQFESAAELSGPETPSVPAAVEQEGPYWQAFLMACLMGAYTLVGFESAANLSEETVNAERTVPKAVVWSVVVSGTVGTLFLVLTSLGIEDLEAVKKEPYPLPTIIESNLGSLVGAGFFVLVGVSIFACGLIIMASGSRPIYAMARDNVFPFSNVFKQVPSKTSVPVAAVVLVLLVGILAELFSDSLQDLIQSAAVLPAVIYLVTICSYLRGRHAMSPRFGTFSLGRSGPGVALVAIIWLLLIISILSIPMQFRRATWTSLSLCLGGVLIYFCWVRQRILSGQAGIRSLHEEAGTP